MKFTSIKLNTNINNGNLPCTCEFEAIDFINSGKVLEEEIKDALRLVIKALGYDHRDCNLELTTFHVIDDDLILGRCNIYDIA